jgi:hypothetical protein
MCKENGIINDLLSRLSFDATIELIAEEELAVLECLGKGDLIDNGSSRIAYSLGDKFVVKVGMSTGGFNQNQIERDFYAAHGDTGYFAHLFAYGRTLNIMEYLYDCQYYDEDDLYYYSEDEEYETEPEYEEIANVIENANELTNYYGGDNGQIGYSKNDGVYKLYDYGYSMDYNRDDIVDCVGCWMDIVDPLENAIEILKGREPYSQKELYDMWRAERGM